MQIRLTRTAKESRTGHMKIVRVPSTVHAVPRLHDIVLPSRPQPKADQPQSARAVPVDDTPAVRARRARWKIRRAQVAVSRSSSLFAPPPVRPPRLDPKRASKWGA